MTYSQGNTYDTGTYHSLAGAVNKKSVLKKYFNQCSFYTALWIIYLNQGPIGLLGFSIMKATVLLLVAWSFFHVVKCVSKYKLPHFMKALFLFLMIQTVYGILHVIMPSFGSDLPQSAPYNYIQSIYISLLPIFSFYYFARNGYITETFLKVILVLVLLFTIASYYFNMNQELALSISSREEVTNNVGYEFVAILPLLIVFRKQPLLQMALVMICFTYILHGMKRGAILIGCIMLIYFVWNLYNSSRGKRRFLIILLLFVAAAVGYYIVMDMLVSSDYFVKRIEDTIEGNSSNRDIIYEKIWNSCFNDTKFFEFLLGRGPNYTVAVTDDYAHQDWLEVLCNLGLVGVIFYFNYYLGLWRDILKKKKNSVVIAMLMMVFIMLIIKSMFSMSYGNIGFPTAICLGVCLGAPNIFEERYL